MCVAITVDVGVIMIGNAMSDQECLAHHRAFLNAFLTKLHLALDPGGQIRQLYENRLGSASAGRTWLKTLATRGRMRHFPLAKIPQSLKAKLANAHFDWTDLKYVQLAMNVPDQRLVTEDKDFSPKIQRILKDEVSVEIYNTESACACLAIS
jgi:hypothetical protein